MDLKELLLTAPDSQLDAAMKTLVKAWDNEPTPIQLLEVLDHCIHGSMSSGMIVTLLQLTYKQACENALTTHEEVVKNATWRNR